MKQNANVQVYNSAVNVLPLQRTLLQETAKIIVHGKLMEDETVQLDLGWAPGGPARETLYFGLLSDLETQWPDTAESRRVRAIIRKRQRAAGAGPRDLRVLCLNQDSYTFCRADTNARVFGFVIEDVLGPAPRLTLVELLNAVQIRNKVVSIDSSSIFVFPSLFLEISCVTYYPVKANMVLRSKHEDLVTIKPQNLSSTSFQFKIPSNSLNSQPIVYLIVDVEPNK